MSTKHSPATARIQTRLERLELEHLRELVAEQAEQIERLESEVWAADARAEWAMDSVRSMEEHLNDGTADTRCIGLTVDGALLVVAT